MTTPTDRFLARLGDSVRTSGKRQWVARCPGHEDHQASLSVRQADTGQVLVHCHAGCASEDVLSALNLRWADLCSPESRQVRRARERGETENADSSVGCSLEAYASEKRFPVDFLEGQFGLREKKRSRIPTLEIPYCDQDGNERALRYRHALTGAQRFSWRRGDTPCLYGLQHLEKIRARGYVIFVEGESDTQTGRYYDFPVLGVPGAAAWKDGWAPLLNGLDPVYLVVEPDAGGSTLLRKLTDSALGPRLKAVRLGNAKDLSALHLKDPSGFAEILQGALRIAPLARETIASEAVAEREALFSQCRELAQAPRILEHLAGSLRTHGVAGEQQATGILFLAMVSRWLPRPVSVTVKGPSSVGKSFVVSQVLRHVPLSSYVELTSASQKALIYGTESIAHGMLVVCEAAGISSDFFDYTLRSLLSEGRLRYEVTERQGGSFQTRIIEREGPTGLILTTTEVVLHPENETRMLSVPVDDSPEQTQRVLNALAQDAPDEAPSLDAWHALQEWLATADHRVAIPFAPSLASLIDPVAVRLRRDFSALLNLIRAHALLHQVTRDRDTEGRVVATLDDYVVVQELTADLFAAALETSVPEPVRDTVDVIQRLTAGGDPCSVTQVARVLKLDASTVSRRVKAAIASGFVVDYEPKPGRPRRLVIGEPLPHDRPILPTVEALAAGMQEVMHAVESTSKGTNATPCTIASISEGTLADDQDLPAWITDEDDDLVRI